MPLRIVSLRPSFAVAALAVAALGVARPQPPGGAASGADRGRRLFDVHCARCHGIGGGGGEGPPLTRAVLHHAPDDEALVGVIRDGIPDTPMIGSFSLSEAEARQVASYVRSLGRAEAAPLRGDVARGRAVYDEQGCGACHIVAGSGRGLGPELTEIGALRGVPYLRESVLQPTAVVADEYRLLTVRTTSGATFRGLRVSEDDFALVLRDADARLHSFAGADLESRRRQMGESLMPSYASRLDQDQVEDLVAYLAALRGDR
jgi:putative heme-binding domain-containing protein